ncbi:MAG: hypothetical protein Q9160_008111 [Pyrenula sp. 1 TL-2023]
MEDFIDLPLHVGASPKLPNEPLSVSCVHSKRHFTDEDFTGSKDLSSDPALFSSDEPAASAETYASNRRKRFWKGTWWGEKVDIETGNRKRAKFTRNFDSGVFLSSDSTESDLDDAFLDDQKSLQLGDLPSNALSQLKTLTKTNAMQEMPSSSQDQAFESLVPNIKLFLANNRFKRLAMDVFQLENLVVLSVRQNEMKKLPDAFRCLGRLEELNVSGNQLESLPHSILYLITHAKLKKLSAFPNPFKGYELGDKNPLFRSASVTAPALVAESRPSYYWKNGRPANTCEITRQIPQLGHSWQSTQQDDIARSLSALPDHVPSLAELALLECSRHEEFFDHVQNLDFEVRDTLDAEENFKMTTENFFGGSWHASELLADMLRLSHTVWLEGGKNCSVCGREFIIQRAAWYEWYQLSNTVAQPSSQDAENSSLDSNIIPFHREACSLSCYIRRARMGHD